MNIYKKKKNENESRHEKDQLEIHGFTSSHHLISLLAFSKSGPCIPLEFFHNFCIKFQAHVSAWPAIQPRVDRKRKKMHLKKGDKREEY